MQLYHVAWKIDIEADSPEEAATQALIVQRDPESTAVVFDVTNRKTSLVTTVDLAEETE